MNIKQARVDRIFLILTLILAFFGFFIFSSAALGILARENLSFGNILFKQFFFGIFLGLISMIIISRLDFKILNKYSLYIFIASILATLTVFIPFLGFEHGGARRWISVLGFSFQPAELLKIGFIIFLSSWLSSVKDKIKTFKFGLLPLIILIGISAVALILQPDIGTLLLICSTGLVMFIVGGGKFKHIIIIMIIGLIAGGSLLMAKPYLKSRLMTFLDPNSDPLGAGYQIQQSLIAIGSGEIIGRGFGKSVQKFNFLPEPIGDSIFAVFAEEWGFLGAIILIFLFIMLAIRGLKIATKVPSKFGQITIVGISTMVTAQAFMNIGSMLGVFPLTGDPLPFVSQGGTALFFTLSQMGIVLSISKSQKQ